MMTYRGVLKVKTSLITKVGLQLNKQKDGKYVMYIIERWVNKTTYLQN